MNKIKTYFRNHKIATVVLITMAIVVVAVVTFLTASYVSEQQRYNQANEELMSLITTSVEYELDNKEHKLKVADFIPSVDKVIVNDDKIINSDDFVTVEKEFIDGDKFLADKVKTETHIIRTNIPKNKIWNKFKHIDTEIKISCVDTTAPDFSEKVDTITINKGEELDVASKFKATDMSGDVNITVDGTVDVNTAGTQTVNIFATDENGNVAQTEVNVVVNEPEKNETTGNNNNETPSKSNSSASTSQKSSSKNSTSSSSSVSSTKNNTSANTTTNNKNKSNSNVTGSASKPNSNNGNTTTTSGCANGNHSMPTGNSGKWFNSRSECQEYMSRIYDSWANKLHNNEISREEYNKKCPDGYECWSCSNCNKWTLNYKYK